jgi:hypothetical protein
MKLSVINDVVFANEILNVMISIEIVIAAIYQSKAFSYYDF